MRVMNYRKYLLRFWHTQRCVMSNAETAPPTLLDKLLARYDPVERTPLNNELTQQEQQRVDAAC